MKTLLTKNLLLLLVVAVFLSACKDDPEPDGGTTTEKYFSGENGSAWIYSNQSISSAGETTTLTANDTLTFVKDTALIGKNAKWVSHNFLFPFGEGLSNSVNYGLAQDGSQLFVSSDFMKLLVPEIAQQFIKITDNRWMMLANGNATTGSSWTIDSSNFTNTVIENFPIPITLTSGSTKLVVERQADTTFNGEASHYYKLKIYYQGSVSSTAENWSIVSLLGDVRMTFVEVNFFLASGKGLLGINAKPSGIKAEVIALPGQSAEVPGVTMPGFAKTLTSTSLK